MARLDELLRHAATERASDLHLGAGLRPHLRRLGALEPLADWPQLSDGDVRALVNEIATDAQRQAIAAGADVELSYAVPGGARVRCNFLVEANGAAAVFRIIPDAIVPLAELSLPAAVAKIVDLRAGLVLLTGPAGSGKSTTLAALVDKINESYVRHIVTIEDPIEFVHKPKRSVVSQRQVGTDAASVAAALRAAMRQDADVIVAGELRCPETIALALEAAERGALVFATAYPSSATKAIDRLVDAFPPERQPEVRGALAESLAAVVAQLLIRSADGTRRVAANEILFAGTGLANLIRDGNTAMIGSLISSGRAHGMQLMDDALLALAERREIDAHDACLEARDKKRFDKLSEPAARS